MHFNGVNGATGEYLTPDLTTKDFAAWIANSPASDPAHLAALQARLQQGLDHLGVVYGVDETVLSEAGWGIVFPAHDAAGTDEVLDALQELLTLRRQQAGDRFRILRGADGIQPGESQADFFARHRAGAGPVDPRRLPYYLLLAASPQVVSYEFQYQADVQHAIGRLHFEHLIDYRRYARSVVQAEIGQLSLPRRAALFGVRNPDDDPTALSADRLVAPLAEHLSQNRAGWQVDAYRQEQARKHQLLALLGGDQTPALLFSASHGVGFPSGHPRQLDDQGALLCQEWPGPQAWQQALPKDFYVAADDIQDAAAPAGLIAFFFGCYSAGTPLLEDFDYLTAPGEERRAIAPLPFVSRLPQRLLSHPNGGALAVVGHVERAWGYAFSEPGHESLLATFQSTLDALLDGRPIGSALDYFNQRYAELAAALTTQMAQLHAGGRKAVPRVVETWTLLNDARNYLLLGDPAVRLTPVAAQSPALADFAVVQPVVTLVGDAPAEPPWLLRLAQADAPGDPSLAGLWQPAALSPWDEMIARNELPSAAGRPWWVIEPAPAGDASIPARLDAALAQAEARLAAAHARLARAAQDFAAVVERWRLGSRAVDGLDAAQVEALRVLAAALPRRRSAAYDRAAAEWLAAQRTLTRTLADPAWVELRNYDTPLARSEIIWGRPTRLDIKPAATGLNLNSLLARSVTLVSTTREHQRRLHQLSLQLAHEATDAARPADALLAQPAAYRFLMAALDAG